MKDQTPAERLFQTGLFLRAGEALRAGPADGALSLEIAYLLGASGQVRNEARKLVESKSTDSLTKGRAYRVWAAQLRDDGSFSAGLEKCRLAVQELTEAGDPYELALACCALLEAESDGVAFERSRASALLARRTVLRSGHPAVMIVAHLTFARLEARVGNYDRALRHLAMAREGLREVDSVYLEAAVNLDESTTLALVGDLAGGLSLAKAAAEKAGLSGWAKGRTAATVNCAGISVLLGCQDDAESYLQALDRHGYESASYQLAVLEARVELALLRNDFAAANALLGSHRTLAHAAGSWYNLSIADTEARVLIRQGRWKEAVSKAEKGLSTALKQNAKAFAVTFRLRRALGLAGLGRPVAPSDLPDTGDLPDWPISTLGTYWLVRAVTSSNAEDAASHANRALRILEGVGDQIAYRDARHLVENRGWKPVNVSRLDSAVALVDVAGHPKILAREALALIDGTRCATQAAVVARSEATLRILETVGWEERHALGAARTLDRCEVIDCGTLGDETIQIIARPVDELEARCTWLAIRKLVATGLTLDRYRRDEKQRAALWPAELLDGDPDCLWISESINEIVRVARRIGPTPLTVLLTGETGTGKEMLAKTIHQASDRADKMLLAFNCTAVPRDMLESQLFGYRRGAFTGAEGSFTGIIRAAEGGTLFLDEIADMPLDVQPKLLRFLETHEVHPLGEPHPIKVDVRVIAATNANLEQLVAEGTFRQDLFYRLNVVRLRLPPLRERREEVPALVEHYVRRYADQQKKGRLTLTDEALEYLLLYPWPGNVRQLANEVNRMVAMADKDAALNATHLSPELQATRRTIPATTAPDSELRISLELSLPEAVELLEKTMVQAALDRSNGRLEDAARLLGISRKGLFLKRRRWGIGS